MGDGGDFPHLALLSESSLKPGTVERPSRRARSRARLKPGVRVCRDKPARCEGVRVSDSEGLANHAGPESCAGPGNGASEALTGERAGRVWSPEIGRFSGADALLTRGRQHRRPRHGEGQADLTGSKTPGMHGNAVDGTREALHLTWRCQVRTGNPQGTRP